MLPPEREIPSIETHFDGVMYRSRTEARWAVFFSELGLAFNYEPERLKLSDGESYLPDFYLPELSAYFEVKAANDAIADYVRINQLRDNYVAGISTTVIEHDNAACDFINENSNGGRPWRRRT